MNGEQDTCVRTASEEASRIDAPMETVSNPYHLVQIRHVENGFVVIVGCKEFVAKDWIEISSKLQEYWKDPRKAEKEFCK